MGADLLIYRPAFDTRKGKPNWEAALNAATQFILPTQYDEYYWEGHIDDLKNPSTAQLHALRMHLHDRVREFKDLWEGNNIPRDVTTCTLGPYELLITGGMSHGDAPSETYELIDDLVNSDLLDIAGFE